MENHGIRKQNTGRGLHCKTNFFVALQLYLKSTDKGNYGEKEENHRREEDCICGLFLFLVLAN